MMHDIQAAMKRIEVIDATMLYCPSKPKTCELCRNLRDEAREIWCSLRACNPPDSGA